MFHVPYRKVPGITRGLIWFRSLSVNFCENEDRLSGEQIIFEFSIKKTSRCKISSTANEQETGVCATHVCAGVMVVVACLCLFLNGSHIFT